MSRLPAASQPANSVVVPVYKNEENIPELLERFADLHRRVPGGIEAVCVVDGSPDLCYELLAKALPSAPYPSRLLLLSRNFGSFSAIREGLKAARGRNFAVMSADLQEEPALVESFFDALRKDEADVVLGTRDSSSESGLDRFAARAFWFLYRTFIQREVPPGGIDVFGCNAAFRDELLRMSESHTSLVGQVIWLGFRRKLVPYKRVPRRLGRSAWTLRRKVGYLLDSVYSFSELPIRLFIALGMLGVLASVTLGLVVFAARLSGAIEVPGYSATVLMVLFFAGLNLLGLGVIGSYVWRAYENTKARPLALVMRDQSFPSRDGA